MSILKNIDLTLGFKRVLLCLVFGIFFLVLIQEIRPFREVKPLNGAFTANPYSPFTFESWFNGDYQQSTENFLNDDFGFRNFLVRVNNQLRFLFFKRTNAKEII